MREAMGEPGGAGRMGGRQTAAAGAAAGRPARRAGVLRLRAGPGGAAPRGAGELGLDAHAVPGGRAAEGPDAAALACLASRLSDAVSSRLWEGATADVPAAKRDAARSAGGLPLRVRVDGAAASISVDAAGAPLFRRGWRARVGAAPLRETLAAALLRAGGWSGDRPFCDPMCGSGTLAIEAALSAARRAPGLDRPLALEALPGHDPDRLERLRAELRAAVRPVPVDVLASDRNAGALRLARKNAEAAGVAARHPLRAVRRR